MPCRAPSPNAGSPPRARGRRRRRAAREVAARFTPACAGTTPAAGAASRRAAVHPRVRGDDSGGLAFGVAWYGSPPRARGRRTDCPCSNAPSRFTPACAGTTRLPHAARCCSPVHPRVRGDDSATQMLTPTARGSPPRARGRRRSGGARMARFRFTPACAGTTAPLAGGGDVARFTPACAGTTEPSTRRARALPVHPRVRGDDPLPCAAIATCGGSPPRARGRQRRACARVPLERFTPACAGTTPAVTPRRAATSVHPRVRGDDVESRGGRGGLPVHPRVRGDDIADLIESSDLDGSPPRARGRPRRRVTATRARRFTPACAGTTD